jgi:hypothetical protein
MPYIVIMFLTVTCQQINYQLKRKYQHSSKMTIVALKIAKVLRGCRAETLYSNYATGGEV